MRNFMQSAAVTLLVGVSLAAQTDRIPSGSQIVVRTNEAIDAKHPSDSRIYSAVVDRDVTDRSGNVVIPRGSDAELVLRDIDNNQMVLDLEAINVRGRRYSVNTSNEVLGGTEERREGVGANKRTGKYVGGGALIGGIIGAIAGGGKGAAIGAATGAGAGAVGQTVTRGGSVKLPSESLVTFRLQRPLTVGAADNGSIRNGRQYQRNDRGTRSRSR